MRTYDEALELLRGLQVPARTETLPVEHALGAVLAADVAAASDQPPFDRATMDGIAVQPGERRAFRVVGSVMAGQRHEGGLAADEAVAIMTGAPVPGGCTVVPVEVVEREGEQARVSSDWDLGRVRNVALRGEDARAGAAVLHAGSRLSVASLAAAAMAGARQVEAWQPPRLGILTTGDEVGATGPAGIEDSNGPLLAAFAGALGLPYERLHVADDEERMIDALRGLAARNEVVVTVGGVSMGERDLVPSAAEAVGLRTLLHRVAIQPGKPVLVCQAEDGRVLMGLPGNPVSVLATAHLFLAPLLGRFLGGWEPQWLERPLAVPHRHRGKRRLFLPARLEADGLHPIAWNGSGDLYAAAHGDGLIDLKAGGEWEAGASLRFLPYLGQGPGERSLLPRDPRGGRVR